MAKFAVKFKEHPTVEVVAKDQKEAIEKAKAERGLDGIGHEANGLLAADGVTEIKESHGPAVKV